MFSTRRAQRAPEPAYEALPESPHDQWGGEDPMAEIVRLVEADLQERTRPGVLDHERLADAIAAELNSPYDPMEPVDVTGRRQAQPPAGYDMWDDESLAALPDDFAFDEGEPRRTEEGVLPPHAAASAPEAEEGASRFRRIGLMAAVAAVALVVGGGAVWWAVGGPGGGFGEPQLVRAPAGPYKIVPAENDTIDEPVEGQAIFSQVDGVPPKGEERLVTREETVPELPGVNPQVSRVILPDGQEVAPDPVVPVESGPRRVRTVLVKPDGTIIENPDSPVARLPAPVDAVPAPGTLDALAAAADPASAAAALPAEAVGEESSSAGLPPIPTAEQSTVPAEEPVVVASLPGPEAVVPAGEAQSVSPVALPVEEPAPLLPPAPAEVQAAAPTPPVRPNAPAQVATAPARVSDGPLDLAAAAAAPAPTERAAQPRQVAAVDPAAVALPVTDAPPASEAAAPAPAGSAFVQVSSQRSQEAALAAFAKMQSKYPNLLAGVTPDVQRADLGAKGVYYRVRVPQPSKEEAASLCQALKSAGADCLIAKK